MNLQQIKTQLAIPSLELNTANDKDGNPTSWMRHWENSSRVAVSIHKDLIAEIQQDKNINSLGLQKETLKGAQGEYTAYRIVKYKPAEITL